MKSDNILPMIKFLRGITFAFMSEAQPEVKPQQTEQLFMKL